MSLNVFKLKISFKLVIWEKNNISNSNIRIYSLYEFELQRKIRVKINDSKFFCIQKMCAIVVPIASKNDNKIRNIIL